MWCYGQTLRVNWKDRCSNVRCRNDDAGKSGGKTLPIKDLQKRREFLNCKTPYRKSLYGLTNKNNHYKKTIRE